MGLKTIHIAFILTCGFFFLATIGLSVMEYMRTGDWSLLILAAACIASAAVLVPYSSHFMKKLRDIGYM